MKKLALAAALLATVTATQAYQVEVQGSSEFIDYTVNDQNYSGAVAATYFLKNVDSSKGPLAEAAFLNQASSVTVAYHQVNLKAGFNGTNILDADVHTYGAKAEAYYATPVAPVYANATYSHNRFDGKNNVTSIDGNSDRWGVEVGVLPINNFLIAVGYTQISDDLLSFPGTLTVGAPSVNTLAEQGFIPAVYETATVGEDNDVITARTKYVGAIDGTNMSVGFEAGYLKGEHSQFSFKSDLYLTPKLSVGGFYSESSLENSNKDAIFGGNVNYFVTDAIAVGATYAQYNATSPLFGNTALDAETYGLNVKARF